jgi:hypothetical protein
VTRITRSQVLCLRHESKNIRKKETHVENEGGDPNNKPPNLHQFSGLSTWGCIPLSKWVVPQYIYVHIYIFLLLSCYIYNISPLIYRIIGGTHELAPQKAFPFLGKTAAT